MRTDAVSTRGNAKKAAWLKCCGLAFLLILSLAGGPPRSAAAAEIYNLSGRLDVSADAAILMDASTGQVLYAKNPFKQRPPASTTKVLTALLALETGNLNDTVTISRRAAYTEGSSMHLKPGEQVLLRDLLYGALLNSGNDACVAIAEHLSGSSENFARVMNMKALALGAVNSHFVNPNGLPDKDHYTCAYDLALIARSALANPVFARIVSTRDKQIDIPGQDWDRRLTNTNKLLWTYRWAEGVKTGTTGEAGQCLIAAAAKDNRRLVTAALKSGNRWADSVRMLESGFKCYEYAQVAVAGAEFGVFGLPNGKTPAMPVVYSSNMGILIPTKDPRALEKRLTMDQPLQAPVKRGQVVGSINYFVNGSYAGRVDLESGADIPQAGFWDTLFMWLKIKLAAVIS